MHIKYEHCTLYIIIKLARSRYQETHTNRQTNGETYKYVSQYEKKNRDINEGDLTIRTTPTKIQGHTTLQTLNQASRSLHLRVVLIMCKGCMKLGCNPSKTCDCSSLHVFDTWPAKRIITTVYMYLLMAKLGWAEEYKSNIQSSLSHR